MRPEAGGGRRGPDADSSVPGWLCRRLGLLCGGVLPAVVLAWLAQTTAGSGETLDVPALAAGGFWLWLLAVVPAALAGAVYLLALALVATWLPGPEGRPELLLAPALLVGLLFAGLGAELERNPALWNVVAGGFLFAVLAGPVPPAHIQESGR